MTRLPEKFVENMKKQLPETEWESFFSVYAHPPVKGVRLNALKGGRVALNGLLTDVLGAPVAWEEDGFYTEKDKLGANPFHFAGLFYSQEPSAMSAAPKLEVKAGEKVLDLCSAPGGKGTQLACKMQGEGVIVLNEPVLSRAKILSGNVERMGIKNAVVASETPERLAEKFVGYFDKILVDAPCSGEGMFRKNADEALSEWSEENVALCAARQKRILREAVKMLKAGGRLVYSTCTFAPQEDEAQAAWLTEEFPEMRLLEQEKLYPHKIKGEGHFVAVFEKSGEAETQSRLRPAKPTCSKAAEKAFREFEKNFFVATLPRLLHETDGVLYDLPQGVFDWSGLHVLRVGVKLGELKNGRFEPSHALVLASKKSELKNAVDLSREDARLEKYLRGETLETANPNGWCGVCVEGFPLGLGKMVGGTLKNHLPKGIRKN
ncbi:MAG: RsmF rRNA methyltransferase first C-terminal domain-containing protein [Clostridia bacterium]|nr:RsmF rRNA methyltransferase first C-terminal domain-containing protein [Clostridia bacterium]